MPGTSKTKLTPELQEKILLHLRVGAYVETAAACAGIHKDTFYEWMKKGARGQQPYVAFAQAVNKAVAESESRDLATILKAAQSQWQAAAWRLERRFPEKYGRNDRLKVDAKIEHDGASLLTKLARLIDGDAGSEEARQATEGHARMTAERSLAERFAVLPEARRKKILEPSRRASGRCSSSPGSSGRAPSNSSRRVTGASGCCARGRGFGKTRTGGEWVRSLVETGRAGRIALVAATAADVRDVVVEGESGTRRHLPTLEPPALRAEQTAAHVAERRHRLALLGRRARSPPGPAARRRVDRRAGGVALPGSLGPADVRAAPGRGPARGGHHDAAPHAARATAHRAADDGGHTRHDLREPRASGRRLLRLESSSSTRARASGSRSFSRSFWTTTRRALFAATTSRRAACARRRRSFASSSPWIRPSRAANPPTRPASSSGASGVDGHAYVLSDLSGRFTPYEWARKAVDAFHAHRADRIVAEKNQGGALVESNLRTVDPRIPYKGVRPRAARRRVPSRSPGSTSRAAYTTSGASPSSRTRCAPGTRAPGAAQPARERHCQPASEYEPRSDGRAGLGLTELMVEAQPVIRDFDTCRPRHPDA